MTSSPPEDPPAEGVPEEPADTGRKIVADAEEDEDEGGEREARLERIVEQLPPEMRGELLEFVQSSASFHRGWLPPPGMLAEYEAIVPGLAERIVRMPEREQAHRHQYLDRESDRQFDIRRRGQNYALAGMALLLGFSVLLAVIGEPVWAARVAIGTIAAVVGIFVTGKVADYKTAKAEKEDEE